MKMLAVGDMHLGRTPSRLPPGLHAPDLGPAEGWRRTVDAALELGVQAVLLAGDVVDRDDDFFEAYRALEGGVRRLADADIDVIGVAGNHDVMVLPRLARHIPRFRLLGGGGTWEPCRVGEGGDAVTLWGWSFPQPRVLASPLADMSFDPAPGINLGLLHCDRDAGPDSPYAPVARGELDRAGLDGWLLGHIHKPDALTAASPSGYLGSLTGLDRGESGPRGPWMITVAEGHIAGIDHLPLAPLRWEPLEVDLAGIGEPADARERLLRAVIELDGTLAAIGAAPDAVGLSVTLTGRTGFGSAALDRISRDDRDEVHTGSAGTRYFIVNAHPDTRPEIDLEELAERPDPVGLLAARLLRLERRGGDSEGNSGDGSEGNSGDGSEDDSGGDSEDGSKGDSEGDSERDRLVDQARRDLRDQAARPVWRGLADDGDAVEPVAWLRRAGYRALDRLLDQLADRRDAD